MTDYKWVIGAFVLGIVLGVSMMLPYVKPVLPPLGNYTLLLDSSYQNYALHLIDSANSTIILGVYSAKYYPNHPNPLLDALCRAAERGVDVRVVLDDELSYNNKTIAYLRSCGVKANLDSPKIRTHAKFLVVDHRLVLLGSTNWSYSSLNKNHEVDVFIIDPRIAKELESYFNRLAQ